MPLETFKVIVIVIFFICVMFAIYSEKIEITDIEEKKYKSKNILIFN